MKLERVYDSNPLFTPFFNDKFMLEACVVTKILPTNYSENFTNLVGAKSRKTSFMNVRNTFVSTPPSHSKQLVCKE